MPIAPARARQQRPVPNVTEAVEPASDRPNGLGR